MLFVQKNTPAKEQAVTEVFYGYDHNLQIQDGAFYDLENLTGDYFPMLAPRMRRSTLKALGEGSLLGWTARDGVLWYVWQGATLPGLYCGGILQELPQGVTLTAGEKQLVSMGAYLCIFPDGIYYNTLKPTDAGYMARKNTVTPTSAAKLTITLCTPDGAGITASATDTEPTDRTNGMYWVDTGSEPHALKQWSASSAQWVQVATTYVKLSLGGIGVGMKQYDGIILSGITGTEQAKALNGSHVLYGAADDYIIITGILDTTAEQTSGEIITNRRLPELDYVTECGNRLWGCYYGVGQDGDMLNEIYCCKLGDFRNWECYMGISTDSYRASVGTDGKWTGAATYNDSPMFFKEDFIHRVYPSSKGAHQVVQLTCEGVQDGSGKSLCVVDNVLYYKSRLGVYRYDGGAPSRISDALGGILYKNAMAATARGKYYIAMSAPDGAQRLFVYDTMRGLWHAESGAEALTALTSGRDTLYAAKDQSGSVTVLDLMGQEGTPEAPVSWWAETGIMTYGLVGKKYISRLNLRMQLPRGSRCDFWVQYDSDKQWRHCGHMEGRGIRSFLLPIRPRRCDHLQFKISGTGDFRLLSLSRVLEAGSDV